MILVRNVFQLRFGKAKEAVALWREGAAIARRLGSAENRVLTDVVGPYYTLVFESGYGSLADFENAMKRFFAAEEWQRWYQKFLPLAEGGRREIFTIIE